MNLSRLRILIVEDELVIAEDLKCIIEELGHDVCGVARNRDEALVLIEEKKPNLVLLDIKINGEVDGVDLAVEMNEKFKLSFIIVTSSIDLQTINRIKSIKPYGYLVKPFNENDIGMGIELARKNFAKEHTQAKKDEDFGGYLFKDSLFVRINGVLQKIKHKDIIYLEADANYTQIYTREKRILVRATLKELEQKLSNSLFARIHKSFMINLEEIEGIQTDFIQISGKEIPIGRNQYSWLLRKIKIL
ncbi:LytR/AlgR family response regulator transcription factor [Cecembia rubra]|uniref:LytTR family two component transcriptional regulator n=1 Tax=Cecembia rubra TaxID=1485585 RepID=A0A2P8DLC2_9BACT|nr:LytTR family transcriptional regulator DNA-binding domain-containing protein [Cecembia rubra]PSK97951.1 LytTR family two component transcriptional regulator [Cecembia rubra]